MEAEKIETKNNIEEKKKLSVSCFLILNYILKDIGIKIGWSWHKIRCIFCSMEQNGVHK